MGSTTSKSNSLYIHVPFCTKKCPYCHFFVLPYKEEHADLLMSGLQQEWKTWQPSMGPLESVYLGGGTPALLGPERIGEVLSWLGEVQCEVTLEANPEELSIESLAQFKAAGVNRLSLGVQSFDPKLLETLGRRHSAEQVEHIIEHSPIENISIDLMYDVPHQTLASWHQSLKRAAQLPVSHISLYNLTIEPGTAFFKRRKEIGVHVPKDEVSAEMYRMAREELSSFRQYEISAFERDDKWSRHNVGYWQGRPFIGLGPSAFSYWNGERFRNVARLHQWARGGQGRVDYRERLDPEAAKRERVVIGLRVLEGVEEEIEGMLSLETQGLLERSQGRWRLTDRGIMLYDYVAAELI